MPGTGDISQQPAGQAILQRLPPEIIHIVAKFLSRSDICQFRLTCRDASRIGRSRLFGVLHVMFTKKSFSNLLNISKDKILRKYVRAIQYEALLLEEIDQEEFDECIRHELGPKNNDMLLSPDPEDDCEEMQGLLKNGWKGYKRLLDEQLYFLKTSYEVAVFTQALPRLQYLVSLDIICGHTTTRSPQLQRAYLESLAITGHLIDGDDEEGSDTGVRAMQSLSIGLNCRPNLIRSLTLDRIGWAYFEGAPESLDFSLPMFRNLRSIHLHLADDYDEIDNREETLKRHHNLGRALRSATYLEQLDLAFGEACSIPEMIDMEREMRVSVEWTTLAGDHTWPNLKGLLLRSVTCDTASMSTFFKRHSRSLRRIKMVDMWLEEGCLEWQSVFETMRENLTLEKLSIGGIWGGEELPDTPQILRFDKNHGQWLAKSIMGGKDWQPDGNVDEEKKKGRRKKVCPHKSRVLDPVKDLKHYALRIEETPDSY